MLTGDSGCLPVKQIGLGCDSHTSLCRYIRQPGTRCWVPCKVPRDILEIEREGEWTWRTWKLKGKMCPPSLYLPPFHTPSFFLLLLPSSFCPSFFPSFLSFFSFPLFLLLLSLFSFPLLTFFQSFLLLHPSFQKMCWGICLGLLVLSWSGILVPFLGPALPTREHFCTVLPSPAPSFINILNSCL